MDDTVNNVFTRRRPQVLTINYTYPLSEYASSSSYDTRHLTISLHLPLP